MLHIEVTSNIRQARRKSGSKISPHGNKIRRSIRRVNTPKISHTKKHNKRQGNETGQSVKKAQREIPKYRKNTSKEANQSESSSKAIKSKNKLKELHGTKSKHRPGSLIKGAEFPLGPQSEPEVRDMDKKYTLQRCDADRLTDKRFARNCVNAKKEKARVTCWRFLSPLTSGTRALGEKKGPLMTTSTFSTKIQSVRVSVHLMTCH